MYRVVYGMEHAGNTVDSTGTLSSGCQVSRYDVTVVRPRVLAAIGAVHLLPDQVEYSIGIGCYTRPVQTFGLALQTQPPTARSLAQNCNYNVGK